MLITTSLITAVVYFYWRLLWIWSLLFAFVFGGIEIAFWICIRILLGIMLTVATLKKIPQGAWFSCALGISLTVFMATWHWTNGKKA
jgi:KUP system potassium uptake protein